MVGGFGRAGRMKQKSSSVINQGQRTASTLPEGGGMFANRSTVQLKPTLNTGRCSLGVSSPTTPAPDVCVPFTKKNGSADTHGSMGEYYDGE